MIDIKVIGSSSKGNCYRVTDGYTPLLLECGLPIAKIKKALNFKLSSIEGCLVTHSHMDHAKAAKDIVKTGINLYATKETTESLGVKGHRVFNITPLQSFTIGSWTILPFETVHDADGSVGFLMQCGLGKLLFLTDTSYCKYRFKGITHLMIECNFSDEILEKNIESGRVEGSRKKRLKESHMSLSRVLDFLSVNDLSQLQSVWLIHLSDDNSDEQLFKKEVQKATGVPVFICN